MVGHVLSADNREVAETVTEGDSPNRLALMFQRQTTCLLFFCLSLWGSSPLQIPAGMTEPISGEKRQENS